MKVSLYTCISRWILSEAKKDGVEDSIAKYDGKLHSLLISFFFFFYYFQHTVIELINSIINDKL